MARRIAIHGRTRADVRRTPRVAARTALPSRGHPGASAWPSDAPRTESCGSFRAVTGFYIAGGILAAWALIVSALGVMREDFPGSDGAARLVGLISVVLVIAAIGTAIYLSATAEHGGEGEGEHAAAE